MVNVMRTLKIFPAMKAIILFAYLLTPLAGTKASAQQSNHKSTPEQQQSNSALIDKNGLLLLIRHVLHALDLSNKSGNYSTLREITAPGFAAINDASRLSQLFRNLRDRNIDLSGTLVYEPQLTIMPEITKDGLMRFAGYFPSASNQIKFEMIFAPVNGQWKLFGLGADVVPSGPAAPIPPTVNSTNIPSSIPKK